MYHALAAALVLSTLAVSELAAQKGDQRVDKTIEITRRDGKLVFIEQGEDKAKAVTIVVGQRIRWENKDTQPHTLESTLRVEGKPLFDTGAIKPGEHKDVVFDIDVYRRAGGKPANVVTVKYQSHKKSDEVGELQLLSAARR
jgi:plastocyanin